ncbi:glycosyltransferase [Algoriphagus kandeliae]|uniref:Glycosyltransferase n=1 Tax=Algoriphagus kandeliae TaxID=2562278 RepID=A0A4Y9QXZ4_9BACT|nr:glycosyltransferase [Algoriphagus kandeliae]TFV97219.1 glycosyltransferase [Algoriphagus kandeliae]
MKILQLIDSLKVGGAERMAVNIALKLSELGIQNSLIVSREGGGLENLIKGKVDFYVLGKKNFADLKAFWVLYKNVKSFNPDFIHAHSSSVVWATLIKIFFGTKTKIIFHDHYGQAEHLTVGDRIWLRLISFKIDGIIAVNDKLKEWSERATKINVNSIIQLNNFPLVDLNELSEQRDGPINILHLANFRPQKDHLTLLNSLIKLLEKGIDDWRIFFVGLGESEDYVNLLKDKIKDFGLEDMVLYFGSTDNVEHFLEKSHVGVLSSCSEGLPVSLLEYGLAGLHIVATDVGQSSSVLSKPELGILVPPKDSDRLALALQKAIENAKKGRNQKLKSHIEKKFGSGHFFDKYFNFLKRI